MSKECDGYFEENNPLRPQQIIITFLNLYALFSGILKKVTNNAFRTVIHQILVCRTCRFIPKNFICVCFCISKLSFFRKNVGLINCNDPCVEKNITEVTSSEIHLVNAKTGFKNRSPMIRKEHKNNWKYVSKTQRAFPFGDDTRTGECP